MSARLRRSRLWGVGGFRRPVLSAVFTGDVDYAPAVAWHTAWTVAAITEQLHGYSGSAPAPPGPEAQCGAWNHPGTMRRSRVESSCLRAVGYDPSGRMLELEFVTGTVYDYDSVPPSVHDGLLRAESLGRYFNRHIRGRFRYRQVC